MLHLAEILVGTQLLNFDEIATVAAAIEDIFGVVNISAARNPFSAAAGAVNSYHLQKMATFAMRTHFCHNKKQYVYKFILSTVQF